VKKNKTETRQKRYVYKYKLIKQEENFKYHWQSCKSSLWYKDHPSSRTHQKIYTWCYSGNFYRPSHICRPGL